MSRRHRILIAIEKYELGLWNLALRVLYRARERSLGAGARVDRDLGEALRWASDAARARREEIAFLTRQAHAEARPRHTSPKQAPEPTSGVRLAA